MMQDHLKTRTSRLWLGEDGILRIISDPGAEQTAEDIEENVAAARQLVGDRRAPVLSDISRIRSITREARARVAGDEAESITLATALLVDSSLSRIVGNFFMGIQKPRRPTRLFSSEEEALAWLGGFVSEALPDQ